MTTLAHISYPALAYLGLNHLSGEFASNQELYVLMAGSVLPDMDFVYQLSRGKGFDNTYNHHNWASHWPITYLPLIILAFITSNPMLNLVIYGIAAHLFLDLFYVVDGVMLFYPLSKKFFRLYPLKSTGHHGIEWIRSYKQRLIYKFDVAAFLFLLVILINRLQ